MIVVCEPQCKGISHVEVNSGFLYGLSSAYHDQEILFLTHPTHYKEIINTLKYKGVSIPGLKHFPINFNAKNMFSLSGIFNYFILINKIFSQTIKLGQTKVLFLSTSPIILFTIKLLKQFSYYKNICCTIVLHGELEDIANDKYREPYTPTHRRNTSVNVKNGKIFRKLINNLDKIPLYLFEKVSFSFSQLESKYSLIFKRIFRTKRIMLWKHNSHFKYISLSPHVTANARKYIDTDFLNFNTIYLPIIFNKVMPATKNKYIKFAVFGYGDSSQMYKMLTLLDRKKITKPYLIKIISMDSRGTEGFQNIETYSHGKILTRKEMEVAAKDVDVFLNLYDDSRHSLGCSLSIFEALSHVKPVLHLSNPGYNYYNRQEKPIGYMEKNLVVFVDRMFDMIENYDKYKAILAQFKDNIIEYRSEYDILSRLTSLHESLDFIT